MRSHLHLADNSVRPPKGSPDFDVLYKIRPLIDHFNASARSMYNPGEVLALDESMVAWTGRSAAKTYNPMKPIKWVSLPLALSALFDVTKLGQGYKVETLCDAATNIVLATEVCAGAGQPERQVVPGTKTHNLITRLITPWQGRHHRLVMDNRYQSVLYPGSRSAEWY